MWCQSYSAQILKRSRLSHTGRLANPGKAQIEAVNLAWQEQVRHNPDSLPLGTPSKRSIAIRSSRELPAIKVASCVVSLAGLAAILAGCSSGTASNSPTPIATVSEKTVTTEEVKNYAKALLAIESNRQAASSEIQKLTNEEKLPDITCTKPDTIAALPKNIQDVAVNYCNQSKKIGESHDLTMPRFNAITSSAQSSPELRKRIQNELLRLQR